MGRRGGPDYVQQRPTQDTVALIDCGHTWCGLVGLGDPDSPVPAPVVVYVDRIVCGFCSPGCASRWLIRYELRGEAALAPPPPTPAEVRTWAASQGIPIGDRGRVPRLLVQKFVEAHA